MVSWSLTKGVICFALPVRSMLRIDLVVHVLVNDLFHTSVTPLERIREQKRMKSLPVFPSSGQVRWRLAIFASIFFSFRSEETSDPSTGLKWSV